MQAALIHEQAAELKKAATTIATLHAAKQVYNFHVWLVVSSVSGDDDRTPIPTLTLQRVVHNNLQLYQARARERIKLSTLHKKADQLQRENAQLLNETSALRQVERALLTSAPSLTLLFLSS